MIAVSTPWPPRTYGKQSFALSIIAEEGENLLLIRARQEVEHVEERLDVKLRKEPRGAQDRICRLRVV